VIEDEKDFKVVAEAFPKIGEKLKLLWGSPEFSAFLDELEQEKTGKQRLGFPADVLVALINLGSAHEKEFTHLNVRSPTDRAVPGGWPQKQLGGIPARDAAAVNWPTPHHMHVIDVGLDRSPYRGPEPAVVQLIDGNKLRGSILHIDFDAGVLEFQPETSPRRQLQFHVIRNLYLTRNIDLETIPMSVPPGSLDGRPSRTRRKCVIVFKDSSIIEVDTLSFLSRKSGLFLFAIDSADEVLRWFVPRDAMASFSIGEPIGKTLHDQHAVPAAAVEAGLRTQEELQNRKIGGYLTDGGAVTSEQLEAALLHQKIMSHLKLGDVMVQERIITAAQRDAAIARQSIDRHKPIGTIVVEMGVVTPEVVRKVLVEQLGVPCVNLSRFQCDPNAIKAVSAELAHKYVVMPLYRTDSRIAVAIEDPLSWEALHEIEFFTLLKVDPVIAARDDLLAAVAQFYGAVSSNVPVAEIVAKLGTEPQAAAPTYEEDVAESDSTLVRLVNKIIMDAYDQGASDIHIESRSGGKPSRVRFRVDGVMAPYIEIPPNFRAALVSRLKIMSSLDISERRRSQDGRIKFEDFGPRRIELRMVTLPTQTELEDVVLRILTTPRTLSLEQLGLSPRDLADIKAMATRSFGLLFVVGPTGSGKTTTLHSILGHINTPERKIWTVEDPIEISQDGLCQVQVNEKLGLSFPEVLRSFLRADPDVIMVGETRDSETARTVVSASLTGHLVFSTMHTNSAVESIVRLLDFGLDRFNFSDALIGILGQRLVRRLCTACRTPYHASDEEIDALAHEYCRDLSLDPASITVRWRALYGNSEGAITLHASNGCSHCEESGYKGRLGVYELLTASPAIKSMIQKEASSMEILQEVINNGMVTLEQNAIDKVLQGQLDLKQVLVSCR